MGANNADFQNSALFHGTHHPFNIGDVIEPKQPASMGSETKLAYATPQEETARMFARGNGVGRVFQVEPVDNSEELITRDMKYAYPWTKETVSQKGFKVVKEAGHYAPDGKTYHKSPLAKCKSGMCK